MWAGGTFFTVVLLCQFSVLAGNRFWFSILLMYLGYRTIQLFLVVCLAGCAVVSVFGSGDYDQKKKVLVVCLAGCAVVSVSGSSGK